MARCASILLAEDDENDALLVRMAFERAALVTDLVVVRDGQEAIDFLSLKESDPTYSRPGVFLLDLKMPRVNGFEVLSWLRGHERYMDLPVLVFSSSSQETDVEKARQMGAREYLVKPHEFADLVKVLKDVHRRYVVAEARP